MIELVMILTVITIIFQGVVAYYSYTLFKLVKPIKAWTLAWGLFGISMVIVGVRRAWALGMLLHETDWLRGNCPNNVTSRLVEIILLLAVSTLWVIFVYLLKNIFDKYLGPHSDSALSDREQIIEHREDAALIREDTVGKREDAVQNREDDQKSEEITRKIVNGK
jgi:hypothetical protein